MNNKWFGGDKRRDCAITLGRDVKWLSIEWGEQMDVNDYDVRLTVDNYHDQLCDVCGKYVGDMYTLVYDGSTRAVLHVCDVCIDGGKHVDVEHEHGQTVDVLKNVCNTDLNAFGIDDELCADYPRALFVVGSIWVDVYEHVYETRFQMVTDGTFFVVRMVYVLHVPHTTGTGYEPVLVCAPCCAGQQQRLNVKH